MRDSFKRYLMKHYSKENIEYFEQYIKDKYPIPDFVVEMELDVSERKILSLHNTTASEKRIRLYNLKNKVFDSVEELEKQTDVIRELNYAADYKKKVSENRKDIVLQLDERKYYMSHRQYTHYIHKIEYSFYDYISEVWEIELLHILKDNVNKNRGREIEYYNIEKSIIDELEDMTDYSDSEETYSEEGSTM